jgi:DNA-binding CsgD family transcriptional regulator
LPADHGVVDLIAQTYDAGLGNEDWSALLARLAQILGGDSAVTLHRSGSPLPQDTAVRIGVDPAFVRSYNAHYHKTWPVLPALERLPDDAVFVDRMLVPEPEYVSSEFYNDYARPQGRHSGLYWVAFDQHGLAAHLSVWRSRRRPDWDDRSVQLLRFLGPHLGRALKLERRLAGVAAPRPVADAGLLAPRERDCLAGVARGASSKQIARLLGLSMNTVNAYLASAKRKLKVSSRSEAVATAFHLGLLNG